MLARNGLAMLRLCAVLAVLAVALVAGCRDSVPTERAIQVHAPAANICFTDGHQPSCACLNFIFAHPNDPLPQVCFDSSAQVILSSDHGPRPSISVNSGDTVVFFATTNVAAFTFSVTGYSFVPLPPIAMNRRMPGRGGILPATRAAPARVASAASATPRRSAIFAPGRSAQLLPGVTSCRTSTDSVCFDVFTTSGYEIISATVDGVAERDSILVTVAVPAGLGLTCGKPAGQARSDTIVLVRADTVKCTAVVTNAGPADALVLTDWNFVSRDGALTRNRHDLNPAFTPDSSVWSGMMITSGTITVTGTIGASEPITASVFVKVTPRDWSGIPIPAFPVLPQPVGQGWLPTQPDSAHDLGQTKTHWRDNTVVDSTQSQGIVPDGPNALFFYVKKLPPFVDYVKIAVNDVALSSASAFYAAQPDFNPNVVSRQDNVCYKSDVTSQDTRDKINRHEGSQWNMNPDSHAGVFKQRATSMVVAAAESVYTNGATGIAGLSARWVTIVYPIQAKVDSIAGKPVDRANPVIFGTASQRDVGCHFNYPR